MRTNPFWVIAHEAQPFADLAVEPLTRAPMIGVIGIEQRQQHVDIEQGPHSSLRLFAAQLVDDLVRHHLAAPGKGSKP
jgi:hypothetical protein